jgi:Rps23 Pro-64 3,4-dihydroxylase Tpa1-like proline 4-hydroxylase
MLDRQSVEEIHVTVVLASGITYETVLDSYSDILRDLYTALGSAQQFNADRSPFLIQLPVDGGHTAVSFMSHAVVALHTTPPVLIREVEPAAVPVPQRVAVPAPLPEHTETYLQIDDFLTPGENLQLMEFAIASEGSFTASSVVSNEKGHRSSKVLFAIAASKWREVFLRRLQIHLPHIFPGLGFAPFEIGNFEIQLTASNDGDFFKLHSDSGHEVKEISSRQVTYVYYMNREPKPFSGGGLIVYGSWPDPQVPESIRSARRFEPRNNTLVAFLSHRPHELELVRCPSGNFADSRFTVNGWLHPK